MSSVVLKAIEKLGSEKHTVGSLNNHDIRMVNMGARCNADIDNFNIVELGFNDKGERTCSLLSDITKKGYLIASVEEYLDQYENISAFFNGKDEMARIVIQEAGMRFEASNVVGSDTSAQIKNGMKAHFDPSKNQYIVSNGKTEDSAFATAGNKYIVVDAVGNTLGGQQTYRLEFMA